MWKPYPIAPRGVVMAIPVDSQGSTTMHLRSQKCRSARGIWSFPTGLHEIGETVGACAARELLEEWSLTARGHCVLGHYEHQAVEDGWHWSILVLGVIVDRIPDNLRNNEPEKHERPAVAGVEELLLDRFYMIYKFHRSFEDYMKEARYEIHRKLMELIDA